MEKGVIYVVIKAISQAYAGDLKDNTERAEDDPTPTLTDTTDHTAGQAAETADGHTHNDPQTARKDALHPTTKTAFISAQLRYSPRKT